MARTRPWPRSAGRGCRAGARDDEPIERADRIARTSAAHSMSSSRVVAKRRPFGTLAGSARWPDRPTRCNATAIDRGDPIWQTRLTEPMSMPSWSDAVATTARSSPRFSRCSPSKAKPSRQAAVMREDGRFAEPFRQVMRDTLGEPARVDEDERRAVRLNQRGQTIVDLRPHLVGRDCAELVLRHFDCEKSSARRCPLSTTVTSLPLRNLADRFERANRGGETNSLSGRPPSLDDENCRAARARAPDARRACRRRRRGSRRRSRFASSEERRGFSRPSAG